MRHYAGSALMLLVTMAAALGCYTINLKVSGERAAVEGLRRQLVADARDMRNLQAELRTRARLPEMQRWNDNVLLMSAPVAGQFLRSPVQLASYGAVPARPEVQYAVATPDAVPLGAALVTPVEKTAYRPDAAAAAAAVVAAANPAARAPRIIRASYATAPLPSVALRNTTPAANLHQPLADLIIDIDLADVRTRPARASARAVAPAVAPLADGGQ